MGLPPGRPSNNPAGRPKGAPNKVTKELRERMADFLGQDWEQVEQDFMSLDAPTRIALYERLLKYVLPAMQAISMDANVNSKIESLSDEQINKLIDHIIKGES